MDQAEFGVGLHGPRRIVTLGGCPDRAVRESHGGVGFNRFLTSLVIGRKAAKAVYPFDAKERFDWHFIPRGRKGVPIKELSSEQRALRVRTGSNLGLSGTGFLKRHDDHEPGANPQRTRKGERPGA